MVPFAQAEFLSNENRVLSRREGQGHIECHVNKGAVLCSLCWIHLPIRCFISKGLRVLEKMLTRTWQSYPSRVPELCWSTSTECFVEGIEFLVVLFAVSLAKFQERILCLERSFNPGLKAFKEAISKNF